MNAIPIIRNQDLHLIETGGNISAHPGSIVVRILSDGTRHDYNPLDSFPSHDRSYLRLALNRMDLSTTPYWRFKLGALPQLKDSYDISPDDIDLISSMVIDYTLSSTSVGNEIDVIVTTGLSFGINHAKEIEKKVSAFFDIYPYRHKKPKVVFIGGMDCAGVSGSHSEGNLRHAIDSLPGLTAGYHIQFNGKYIPIRYAAKNLIGTDAQDFSTFELRWWPQAEFGNDKSGLPELINQFAIANKLDITMVGPKPVTAFGENACEDAAGYRPRPEDLLGRSNKWQRFRSSPRDVLKHEDQTRAWVSMISQENQQASRKSNLSCEARTIAWISSFRPNKSESLGHCGVILHCFADFPLKGTTYVRDKIIRPSLPEESEFQFLANSAEMASRYFGLGVGEWSYITAESEAGRMPVRHVWQKELAEAEYATSNAGREGSLVFNPKQAVELLIRRGIEKNDGFSGCVVSDELCKSRQKVTSLGS